MDQNIIQLILACVGVVVPISLYSFTRIIKGYDESIRTLFNKVEALEKDHYTLAGEHKRYHNGSSAVEVVR